MRQYAVYLCLALILISPVMAQENGHRGDNAREQNEGRGRHEEGGNRNDGNPNRRPQQQDNARYNNTQNGYRNQPEQQHVETRQQRMPGHRFEERHHFENWRQDNRYNWQAYRNDHRNFYRLPDYYAPRGYAYQRYGIGFFLPGVFFNSNFFIGNPWYYRLPPAYAGTRWVRYYHDVLLIDLRTGRVIDVVYDFFW